MKMKTAWSLMTLVGGASLLFAQSVQLPTLQIELSDQFSIGTIEGEGQIDDALLNRTELQFAIAGKLPHQFSYKAAVHIFEDRSSFPFLLNDYQPHRGVPYNVQSEYRRTWDLFTGTLRYQGGWLELQTGIDHLTQGPARRNPLVLGGAHLPWRPWQHGSSTIAERSPLLHATFTLRANPISYTQTTGSLLHTVGYDKFFHNHRLELRLGHTTIGVGEQIIYGSTISTEGLGTSVDSTQRQIMWGYALPFIPYQFAEHYFGDRDNSALFLDWSTRPFYSKNFSCLELYGELLIDDLKSLGGFFDDSWWGNKWAFTGGVRNRHKEGTFPWGWGWEFTRIEPWVGTHHQGGGYDASHYGWPLGSDLGPNSREHWLYIDLEPPAVGLVRLFHSSVWKGTDHGSQIGDIHSYLTDGEGKKFLDPKQRLRWNEFGVEWSRKVIRNIEVSAAYSQLFGDEKGWRGGIGVRLGLRPL